MSEKHTPGKLMGEVNINDLGAKQIRYSLGIGTTILFHTSFENSRPNANRMMKCWNSHDALLEACKASEEADKWFGPSDTVKRLRIKARELRQAAIALAEKVR